MKNIERECLMECMKYIIINSSPTETLYLYNLLQELENETSNSWVNDKMKGCKMYLDHIHNLTSEAENKIKESIDADKK